MRIGDRRGRDQGSILRLQARRRRLDKGYESESERSVGSVNLGDIERGCGQYYPKDHARREDEAEGEDLNGDVDP